MPWSHEFQNNPAKIKKQEKRNEQITIEHVNRVSKCEPICETGRPGSGEPDDQASGEPGELGDPNPGAMHVAQL